LQLAACRINGQQISLWFSTLKPVNDKLHLFNNKEYNPNVIKINQPLVLEAKVFKNTICRLPLLNL